jgi:5-methylcytosine-specific restriction endonuclease McrA
MRNIFLAPRSNETSHKNFESTIIEGRSYSFIEPYLSEEEKRILSKYPTIRVWGNKGSLRGRWEKMKPRDFVLFYAKGSFYYGARVVLTKYSEELGRKLWPADENGVPWTCLFFIENLKEINIPIRVVQELAEYEPTWDRVQGFMALRDSGVKAIEERFGSAEIFLSQEPEVYEVIENIIEIDKEESLEIQEYVIRDRSQLFRDASNFVYGKESHKIDTQPRKTRIENQTQKRRIAALENYRCQICDWSLEWKNSKGKKSFRIDVDHIIDKAKGGTEAINNLWVLCPNCHAKKTLGVIKIDPGKKKIIVENKEQKLHHDNHLNW